MSGSQPIVAHASSRAHYQGVRKPDWGWSRSSESSGSSESVLDRQTCCGSKVLEGSERGVESAVGAKAPSEGWRWGGGSGVVFAHPR